MKILIVEDQNAPLKAIEDAISSVMPRFFPNYTPQGKDVARCYSDAMNLVTSNEYGIVLLDHRMPIQNTGNLERENFDMFSAQLVNIGYSLIPIIQQKSPHTLIIGTSSLSRHEIGQFDQPKHTMSKMYGEVERDLERILEERRGEGENAK